MLIWSALVVCGRGAIYMTGRWVCELDWHSGVVDLQFASKACRTSPTLAKLRHDSTSLT